MESILSADSNSGKAPADTHRARIDAIRDGAITATTTASGQPIGDWPTGRTS